MGIAYLIIGLTILAISSNYLVNSSVTLAKRLKISSAVIGLTIVAMGTSLPELVTSVLAALENKSAIAIGNVVGSNIFNTLGILGIAGLITHNIINANSKKIEIPIMIFSYILMLIFSLNFNISRIEGLILISILVMFTIYSIKNAKITHEIVSGEKHQPLMINLSILLSSLIGLIVGADFALKGGISIGQMLGLSEKVIGLTIVAIGTSLPEIGATITAAIKGEKEMAVANVIGSNLFNSLGILGVTSLIKPIEVSSEMLSQDIVVMMCSGLLLWILAYTRPKFFRIEGSILLILMASYLTYLVIQ